MDKAYKLRDLENYYEDIIAKLPGNIWWKDGELKYLGCNDRVLEVLGLDSKRKFIGKTDYELWEKDIAGKLEEADLHVLKTGETINLEETIVEFTGRHAIMLTNKSPLRDSDNNIIGILGTSTDITELKDLKNYYEDIISKLPGHVFWKDRNAVLQGCNDLQAKNLGFKSREEVVGKTNYDMIVHYSSEEDRKKQAEDISKADFQVMETDTTLVIEEPLELPNGERRIYFSNKSPLHDKDGKVIGLVGVAFDITDEKKTERRIAEHLRAAAGSIAHELRTPLASIGLSSEFVKKYLTILVDTYNKAKQSGMPVEDINPRHFIYLENRVDVILKQTHYSNSFIDLVLGNLKEGGFDTLDYNLCDIKTVVDNCLNHYPFEDSERKLIRLEGNQTFQFNGDEFLMTNVLNNLIKNSLYFIKAAGKGEISIWFELGKDKNLLYFKDTAKGASAEVVPNLFQSFYSKRQGGIGLGLAFCRKIITSFGGSIEASSVEGEFMLFTLSFPIIENKKVFSQDDTK